MSREKGLHKDCLKCGFIPCVNFYREFEGGMGEILSLETRNQLYPPCHSGVLLYVICQLLSKLDSELPSYALLLQCIRDLKASSFLLLSGHYRTSLMILRTVVEMCLAGLYFDYKYYAAASKEEVAKVVEQINMFYEEKYTVPPEELKEVSLPEHREKLDYYFLLRWLKKKKVITGETMNELQEFIRELNNYIHVRRLEVLTPNCPACPALVRPSKEEYERAIEYVQYVGAALIDSILARLEVLSPGKTRSEEVIKILKDLMMLRHLEKELKMRFVFSKNLQLLLEDIEEGYRRSLWSLLHLHASLSRYRPVNHILA